MRSNSVFLCWLFLFGVLQCPSLDAQSSNQPIISELKECICVGDFWALNGFAEKMNSWELDEESSRVLSVLSLYFTSQYDDALVKLHPLLVRHADPAYAVLHARVLAALGRTSEAIHFLEDNIRTDNHATLRTNLAALYLSVGQLGDAIGAASEVIERDLESADSYYVRGLSLWKKGDVQAAISDLEKAIAIRWLGPFRNEGIPHLLCAIFYSKTGDIEKAKHLLEIAVKKLPKYQDAAFLLCKLETESGRFVEALSVAETFLQNNPSSSEASGLYVKSLMNLNRLEEAEDYTTKWFARDPNNALAANLMSHILFAKGELLKAFEFAERSKELAPLDVKAQATFVTIGLHILTKNEVYNTGRDEQVFAQELTHAAKELCEGTQWETKEHVELLAAVHVVLGREDEFFSLLQERIAREGKTRTIR